jgi:hypothetical protein
MQQTIALGIYRWLSVDFALISPEGGPVTVRNVSVMGSADRKGHQ